MEANHDEAVVRQDEMYDKDPEYVFNLAIIHSKQVHPIIITTTLSGAKDYVRRVMKLYNDSQIDADLVTPYVDDMWVRASETMHLFVLGPGSEYRILRMKLNDASYLDKQEELAKGNVKTNNVPV